MDQFCIVKNHGVKFDENRITFDPSPLIKPPLEIYIYAYKWLKNIGIMINIGMSTYFINLNHITKFCYGRLIIPTRPP